VYGNRSCHPCNDLCKLFFKDSVTTLKTDDQKISYMIGLDMGAYLKNLGISIDRAALDQGIEDTFDGAQTAYDQRRVSKLKEDFGRKMQAQQMSRLKVTAIKTPRKARIFLQKTRPKKA